MGDPRAFLNIPRQEAGYRPVNERITDYRQELHERIRELSMIAGKRVKQEGLDNNLLELIADDPMFGVTLEELQAKLATI